MYAIIALFSCSIERKHAAVWPHIPVGCFQKRSFGGNRMGFFALQIPKDNIHHHGIDGSDYNQSQRNIVGHGRLRLYYDLSAFKERVF